jgi:hypothetical protein
MTIAAYSTPAAATDLRRAWSRGRRRRATSATPVAATAPTTELTWENRRPGSPGFARWAADIGHHIDQHGLTALAPAIDSLVVLADHLGVAPVASKVLADPTEPEPARLRAFALVVQAILAAR